MAPVLTPESATTELLDTQTVSKSRIGCDTRRKPLSTPTPIPGVQKISRWAPWFGLHRLVNSKCRWDEPSQEVNTILAYLPGRRLGVWEGSP